MMQVGPDGDVRRFGYAGEPSGVEYERWREEFCRRVMTRDAVPLTQGSMRCEVAALPLPCVKMTGAFATPMRFVANKVDADHALALVLASDAPMRIAVGNRTLDLAPMTLGLADAAHVGAHVSQLAEGRFRSIFIGRKVLLELCRHAEDLIARPVNADAGVMTLLQGYYDLVIENAHGLDATARNAAAEHLTDLVVLALGAGRDAARLAKDRGLAAARLEAVKADVLARIADGDLGLADVAQRNRVSPRYVQILFERTGTTFSEFVLEQRLIRAARLLRDPLHRSRKVSDISYLAGFNDVSYFHRAFRRRFGMTPGDMRGRSPREDRSRSS